MADKKIIAVIGSTVPRARLARAIRGQGRPFALRAIRAKRTRIRRALARRGGSGAGRPRQSPSLEQASPEPTALLRHHPWDTSADREGVQVGHSGSGGEESRAPARDLVHARGHAQARAAADDRPPTLQGKFKVPHFDGKGAGSPVPRTPGSRPRFCRARLTGRTSSIWLGPRKNEDGTLTLLFLWRNAAARHATEDGCARLIFRKGTGTGKRLEFRREPHRRSDGG
jgi:hypothetical protein